MDNGESPSARPGEEAARACTRCSSPMDLLTLLPRTGEYPSYRISGCTACHFVEWVAEQTTGE